LGNIQGFWRCMVYRWSLISSEWLHKLPEGALWAEGNPHEIHMELLHSEKIRMWCALSCRWLSVPYSLIKLLPHICTWNIFSEFVNQLTNDELIEGYFQQDGTTCHTSNASMGNWKLCWWPINLKSFWPLRSSDLKLPDFYLWGLLKDRVYSNKLRTIDTLKDMIQLEVAAITYVTLPNVFANLQTHIQKCLDAGGGRVCFFHFVLDLWYLIISVHSNPALLRLTKLIQKTVLYTYKLITIVTYNNIKILLLHT
jgi:hypothetical protein